MSTFFHYYKLISILDYKERRKAIDSNLYPDLTFQDNGKTKGKDILFDKTCEKWRDLIHALHREDRELLLNIYSYRYRYDGNYSFTNCSKDSKLENFLYFYSITLLHYQKNNQRIKRRDMTNKTTQEQDYLLIMSTIAFPDYIKN